MSAQTLIQNNPIHLSEVFCVFYALQLPSYWFYYVVALRTLVLLIYYRAHTKYDAKVMFSEFLSFCPQPENGHAQGHWAKKCSCQEGVYYPKMPFSLLSICSPVVKRKKWRLASAYKVKLQGILGYYLLKTASGHEHFVHHQTWELGCTQ